jgi:hypothetical protein
MLLIAAGSERQSSAPAGSQLVSQTGGSIASPTAKLRMLRRSDGSFRLDSEKVVGAWFQAV